jgi:hypothetical protein
MPTGANAYANRDRYLHTYGDRDRDGNTYCYPDLSARRI